MTSIHPKIQVLQGDITKFKVDVIVNAANASLMGGGGVDGAIHRAGGPSILEACRKIVAKRGNCPAGQAVITKAGNLPAKFVIHTVGPIWHGGDSGESTILADCYNYSLKLAVENGCTSMAFPNISTGIYQFPKPEAAKIAIDTVSSFLSQNDQLEKVIFVCFDRENYELIKKMLGEVK